MATRAKRNGTGQNGKKTRYWLSFDLGLMGDYSHLYEWLDSMEAQECGSGMATVTTTKSREQLEREIQRLLKGAPKARAYVIAPRPDGKFAGEFVAGGRKAAPWAGFAIRTSDSADES